MDKVFLTHEPDHLWLKPIPKDTVYKGARLPAFLDKVKAKHTVKSDYIQIIWDRYAHGRPKADEGALENANRYFKLGDNPNNIPNAVRVFNRYENRDWESKEYVVVGVKKVREGEVWRDYDSGRSFTNRREHVVAVLTNELNKTIMALVTDLVWVE